VDQSSVAIATGNGPVREIKEWQAVMDYLRPCLSRTEASFPQSRSMSALMSPGDQSGLITFG